ncbi:hypothetical protein KL930_004584 [Ogataea haglerorum]|uniref:Ubiquitin-like domain-containing protein n=1 Tax=Ogataea haglerorum TaxID=1937702 RepID=A0AAN6D3H4_9ASCO|nr:hypothetical protein KL915_001524 [Ogataea haglerorum]KAG7714695.1 hypothetical protein KL913_004465 [Ogataea haglerorum]KAG7715465.1 hypothetical protein KL949_004379 [Ogataea haglerorum]KAG7724952.1 hypothetical protein KL933_004385 [Ogataea haglerorum]KAG7737146.1 hypothetical protein KL932_004106 [Ogataea haglerorum]
MVFRGLCRTTGRRPALWAQNGRTGGARILDGRPVTIKSLRPPKFEHEFKFDSTTSIYKVKEELAKKIGSSPDHLTLMLKTKTVHDEDLLEKVATEGVLKLNAMVKARPETTETTRETVKPASGLSPEAWAKISQILESEIVDEAVRNEYLQKLKRVRM